MDDDSLHIPQDELENTVSIHQEAFKPTPTGDCDDRPADGNEYSSQKKHCLDKETYEHQEEDDNTQVIDNIIRHIGSGPEEWFEV